MVGLYFWATTELVTKQSPSLLDQEILKNFWSGSVLFLVGINFLALLFFLLNLSLPNWKQNFAEWKKARREKKAAAIPAPALSTQTSAPEESAAPAPTEDLPPPPPPAPVIETPPPAEEPAPPSEAEAFSGKTEELDFNPPPEPAAVTSEEASEPENLEAAKEPVEAENILAEEPSAPEFEEEFVPPPPAPEVEEEYVAPAEAPVPEVEEEFVPPPEEEATLVEERQAFSDGDKTEIYTKEESEALPASADSGETSAKPMSANKLKNSPGDSFEALLNAPASDETEELPIFDTSQLEQELDKVLDKSKAKDS